MQIVRISLPTPLVVGDVNVYLIKDDPITLIDTGPKTKQALDILRERLAQNGVKLSDIRRIVLTHAHEDHCGLAKTILNEAKDVKIFVHEWETGHLFGRFDGKESEIMLRRVGVPDDVIEKMRRFYRKIRLLTDSLHEGDFEVLSDETELEFSKGVLKVLHTPGHTPGSCSFFRQADRTLICGDCVLKRITPNPVISPDPYDSKRRFPSLAEYLVSLARLRSLSPTLTHGGHGDSVKDFEEIFNRYLRAIEERQRKIISLVTNEGITGFEVATKMFPSAIEQDHQRFLAVSETVAHLDYAVMNGKIALEIRHDGVEFYRRI
ncbi:MAG: MBL fold metallo-hydrolase [Acidobacteria bacterium]|jgi:glyoxylase-like metal-dependent hydrolase (beta-lactamase superfamily II)|nr:MAG: MBL fold metallo-hydrolase [Acidobacteriota bacterium]GIU82724.1 MAG: hydrolase [Pyrinomonadaceae bacterium]